MHLGNNNSPLEIKYHQLGYYLKFYINQDAWHPDLLVQGSFQHKAFMAKIEKQVIFYITIHWLFKVLLEAKWQASAQYVFFILLVGVKRWYRQQCYLCWQRRRSVSEYEVCWLDLVIILVFIKGPREKEAWKPLLETFSWSW